MKSEKVMRKPRQYEMMPESEELRVRMAELGISSVELARKAGVTERYVRSILNNQVAVENTGVRNICALLDVLQIPVGAYMERYFCRKRSGA